MARVHVNGRVSRHRRQASCADEVFALISRHDFRVDATILEKAKAVTHRQQDESFYELAWFLHLKHVAPRVAWADDELFVVSAAVATKKKRALMGRAVSDAVQQTARSAVALTTYRPAASDPCLQVADYCCWAIQRKWERGDPRSHVLIQDKIQTEFDAFSWGTRRYY